MELCHVTTALAWQAAQDDGRHAPDALARDGFLHCCTPDQLSFVLARHFPDPTGLVVLHFDADATPAELRWVESEPGLPPFPHLFGAIPVGAVRRVETVRG